MKYIREVIIAVTIGTSISLIGILIPGVSNSEIWFTLVMCLGMITTGFIIGKTANILCGLILSVIAGSVIGLILLKGTKDIPKSMSFLIGFIICFILLFGSYLIGNLYKIIISKIKNKSLLISKKII